MSTPTVVHLADGREIFYFDDPDTTADRGAADRRPLTPGEAPLSIVRFDQLTGEWVAMASHRNNRTYLPPADECPLCPSAGDRLSEIPADSYDVAVFENRFPSLHPHSPELPASVDGTELWPQVSGRGRCEVVCFSSQHEGSFSGLSAERVRTVIDAWAHRTEALSALPGVRNVFVFENRGAEIGVTLPHPHGQIYAYPYLPPRVDQVIRRSKEHHARTGQLLQAAVLEAELSAGTRVVLTGQYFSAYVPAAARWPLEVHLAPHRDVPDLAALDTAERTELAELYLELLRRVEGYFPGVETLPYISSWHQAPVGEDREFGRLYLNLFSIMRAPGKMKFLAGSESAAGAWINDSTPEDVAARLREV